MIPREPGENEKLEIEEAQEPEKALADVKEKAETYLGNWQRAQADFINYKRRSEQEKEEIAKYASSQIILSILPALDDFERAFESITPEIEAASWIEGLRLIERNLRKGLEAHGVTQIEALGKKFDPNLHDAARYMKGKEGIVIEEIRNGYKLHDKVLRPAMVIVGNGAKADEEDTE